ncbi:MAG: efflux RND transporter periplasmic adaptor subunit [Planctomycetota bacterium]|nr:efflux RND transporter periplasmic adaptor subunit [Planctomycetota bacterium]
MSSHPDLEALRRSEPVAEAPRKPWLPRLTAIVLVLGLLGALYAVLRPVFFPPREVRITSVRSVEGGPGSIVRRGATVTAAGWIEAYPFPVTVRPLVKGVVAEVKVLEGTPVTKDETVLAILRNADIENALVLAQAELDLRAAEKKKAGTVLSVARSLLEQKIPLRSAVAQHVGELAAARAEHERSEAAHVAAKAALATAQVDLRAQRELERAGQATPTALARAQARVREREENVTAMGRAATRARAEVGRHEELLALAREAVNDPRGLQGAVDEAQAELERAQAAHRRAAAALSVAQRNHDLLTIKSPITGVVLRLESAPGALVGPQGEFKGMGEGAGSTGLLNRMTGTVCSLYDPKQLQVRVDVPYADLPGIAEGTSVEIEVKALPGRTFPGVVDRLVREADITQAKLQVKVRLQESDDNLRPEMLCTTRFLMKDEAAAARTASSARLVEVPAAAVRGEAVFVYDPTGGGRARRVSVRIVRDQGDRIQVAGDLGPSSKVILDAVEDGEPVKVTR